MQARLEFSRTTTGLTVGHLTWDACKGRDGSDLLPGAIVGASLLEIAYGVYYLDAPAVSVPAEVFVHVTATPTEWSRGSLSIPVYNTLPQIPGGNNTAFFNSILVEAATLKGLLNDDGTVKSDDPAMVLSVNWAYSQICEELDRPFEYAEYVEYHDEYRAPLQLRAFPPDANKPVSVLLNGTPIEPENVKFVQGRLVLYNDGAEDPSNPRYKHLQVTYWGGYTDCGANTRLRTGMVMQALANYHRRNTFGLAESSGQNGVYKRPSDSGELLDSVRQVVARLAYTGSGYSADGE